jgi:pyrimidine operon attenuation protein/uracil phosphoribosyltransferase
LAQRLRRLIAERAGDEIALGSLDITFHRDDVHVRGGGAPLHAQPVVRATRLDFPLEGMTCVLCDDVLYTGRTIRAAIDALFDYGRPARVQLAVIVDRGHRELPIRPDYVGKNLPTACRCSSSRSTRSTASCSSHRRNEWLTYVPCSARSSCRRGARPAGT